MPLPEPVLSAIVEAVFGWVLEHGAADWVRDKLGRNPAKLAFRCALGRALEQLETQHPTATASLFDVSFLQHEGAPILAKFLVRDGRLDASELAARWADSLNVRDGERHTTLTRELEPVAADFLDNLGALLKAEHELDGINDSRAFEQMREDLEALRRKLGAEQATPGTKRDYLFWLIQRNAYVDLRGTMQTQRQGQVKLDEVYVSLRAQRDELTSTVDRKLLEQELADLDARHTALSLAGEEREDQREHVLATLKNRNIAAHTQAGETLELAEVVQHHHRLVVLGDPGSGKTTLVRYLALKHAQAQYNGRAEVGDGLGAPRFPLLIRIAEYAQDGRWKQTALSDFLQTHMGMQECPARGVADLVANELDAGGCLVLLDGLDEIVSPDDRRGVVQRIEDFVRRYDRTENRFVVTSRVAGYNTFPLSAPFAHYTVQEMNAEQIRRFLERWCAAFEAKETPDLAPEQRAATAQREIDGILQAIETAPGVRLWPQTRCCCACWR